MRDVPHEGKAVVTFQTLLDENKALRTIIFELYNGGKVREEHVTLYQEIGEGTTSS